MANFAPADVSFPIDKDEMIGIALVASKRCADSEPFHFGYEPVYETQGKWYFRRPRAYKRGGKGCEYKLLPDTLIKIDSQKKELVYY